MLLSPDGRTEDKIVRPLQGKGIEVTIVRDLATALSSMAGQSVVVLDARDEATLAMLCRRINDETGSRHAPILAIAHTPDVEARIRLLEAGADDVLATPIDERELDALMEALMLRSSSPAEPTDAPKPVPAVARTGPGRVIAFVAAKGGSGTTTLAVNTALVLAEMAPGSVAIADLDMLHGQIATHLDIYARNSTAQMAREDPASQPPDVIQESGRQHSSGLMVFGGPYRPDEAMDVSGEQLGQLVDALRKAYGTVVVDAGSTLDMRAFSVLAHADQVVMAVAPDIPSLRLLHAALQVMSETGNVADKTMFVLNHIYARPTISGEQIEEHLGIRVTLSVPYDGENFMRAVNEGQPMALLARRSAAAAAIKNLAELAAETRLEEIIIQPAPKRSIRSLLSRA